MSPERVRRHWRDRPDASATRRIFSALLTVGAISAAAKVAALGKELLVAYTFGAGDLLDAYLIAFVVPVYATNVLGGSFNAAFVPRYLAVRASAGEADAFKLLGGVLLATATLLTGVSLLLVGATEWVVRALGSGFTPEKLALTARLFWIAVPSVVAAGVGSVLAALLNAHERFALAAATPLLSTALVVLALALARGDDAVFLLAAATSGGALLEVCVLAAAARRRGILPRPRWPGLSPDLRAVGRQYLPVVGASAVMGATMLVNQGVAGGLPAGSVSALSYGGKLPLALCTAGALALGTVVLPHFARMVAEGDYGELRRTVRFYLWLTVLVTLPLTVALVAASGPLVRLLFERGAFTSGDAELVALVQRYYFLQLPFYVVGIMGVRLLSAFARNQWLFVGSVLNLVLTIVANLVFVRWMGVAGIALSSSLVYLVSCLLIWTVARRLLRTDIPRSPRAANPASGSTSRPRPEPASPAPTSG